MKTFNGEGRETKQVDYAAIAPEAVGMLLGLTRQVEQAGIEPSLLELIRTRSSQMNGCAYCVDMHTKDARQAGESEQRLYALTAWRETPFFSRRERAALAWTEAVTRLGLGPFPEHLADEVREEFSDHDLVYLTLALVAINGWNRLAIPLGAAVGSYTPRVRG